jgi:integrase
MSKLAKPLTAVELRSLPDKSCVAVGVVSGLYARKRDERIYFFLRYSVNGIRRDFGIGSYPQLSLSQARIKAAEVRAMIENGEDPSKLRLAKRPVKIASEEVSQEVKRKADRTFEALGRKWVETRSLNGFWVHNKKGEIETLRVLELHVFPYLGKKDIDDITPEDVCETLSHIWQSKCHTARKAKTYIHKVFQWAIALRMRTNRENPAAMGGALGVLIEPLQKRKKAKSNFAAADVAEIPQLFKDMKEYISISARACEFAILTAARSQAVRLAQWDEFDLKQGLWTIPIEHDKIKIPNRDRTICLSTQAIELLNSLPRYPVKPSVGIYKAKTL